MFPFVGVTAEFAAGCVMAIAGKAVSGALMVYTCVATAPLFPAESLAKYFSVAVEAIKIGELYTALDVVGLLPLVV